MHNHSHTSRNSRAPRAPPPPSTTSLAICRGKPAMPLLRRARDMTRCPSFATSGVCCDRNGQSTSDCEIKIWARMIYHGHHMPDAREFRRKMQGTCSHAWSRIPRTEFKMYDVQLPWYVNKKLAFRGETSNPLLLNNIWIFCRYHQKRSVFIWTLLMIVVTLMHLQLVP